MGACLRRSIRAALAGSLVLGDALIASVLVGTSPASAAAVVQTIAVGHDPFAVSSDGTHVWVTSASNGPLTEIDASTGAVVQTIDDAGVGDYGVSSDGTHVWVTSSNSVTELDASTGAVVQTIFNPGGNGDGFLYGVSSDGTHVWVTDEVGNTVTELDASTGAVVQTIAVGDTPYAVSSDGTHVWVANHGSNTVTELDASTGALVRNIRVGPTPYALSSDGTHVWVVSPTYNSVTELNASTGRVVRTISVGGDAVSSDGAHVWVTNGEVTELDASTGAVVGTIGVGVDPNGISSDGTHVWVANTGNVPGEDGTVSEIAIANGSLQITTTSLPAATVGQPYSFQLQATGGTPPYTWNKYGPRGRGVLPIWLHLSKSGLISGTPRRSGTYTFIVKCLESTAHPFKTVVTQELTLTVNP